MVSPFLFLVLLRAAAAAAVVVSASVLAEAVGPFWGGLIISLPISAGPAYVMLGLQHDAAFIAAGALASLATNAVTILFIVAIILLAPRLRWPVALGLSLTVWLMSALLVRQFELTLIGIVLLNLAAFGTGFFIANRTGPPASPGKPGARRRWFDLPLRALLVGSLTATVVTSSRWLGPSLTGMAAVFPIALTGLGLVVLPRLGGAASAALFASTLRAMPGFAIAVLVLHLSAMPLGTWWAMLCALLAQLAFSAMLLLHKAATRWRRVQVSARPRPMGRQASPRARWRSPAGTA